MRFVALLIAGSATLLISCSGEEEPLDDSYLEKMLTQQSDTLTIINSTGGRKAYKFDTPLMERYEYAREPYMEFRKGVYVETYDSTGVVESTLIADYAIYYENKELWEAKGNVVGTNAKGQILETQQLFWNRRTGKIYSNIDSRITQGSEWMDVVGFESDEEFQDWHFRRARGVMWVNVEPNRDTTTNRPSGADLAPPDQSDTPQADTPQEPSSQVTERSAVGGEPLPAANNLGVLIPLETIDTLERR